MNVVQFPGSTTLDIDPDQVLESAKGKLASLVIVGLTEDDDLYIAASSGDLFLNHYLASMAVKEMQDMN